jgi:3-oxoadipate enol-lactonase
MPIAAINGQGIYYEDSGGSGPAVVCMHGFLMDQSMFDPQVAVLSPNYRCVRFDARGLGQTVWDGRPFSLYDTAADCVGLMDHLAIDQAVIIGMSQGGYAALRLALRHGERVKALVLIGTRSGIDPAEVQAAYREVRDVWRSAGPIPPLVEGLLTAIIGPQAETSGLWEVWRPKWEALSGEQIFHAMNNLLDRDDIDDAQLAQIQAPALIIHGEEDSGVPIALGEALHKALPNSKGLVRVRGAAHAVNLTHPEIVNPALLAFLDRVASHAAFFSER